MAKSEVVPKVEFVVLWNEKEARCFAGVMRVYRVARTSRATGRWESKLSGDPRWGDRH